ncbi:hypothetical protein VTO73DRAFT_2805 [Trametes versicolor]
MTFQSYNPPHSPDEVAMIPGGITVNAGDSELVKSLKGHQKLAIAYPGMKARLDIVQIKLNHPKPKKDSPPRLADMPLPLPPDATLQAPATTSTLPYSSSAVLPYPLVTEHQQTAPLPSPIRPVASAGSQGVIRRATRHPYYTPYRPPRERSPPQRDLPDSIQQRWSYTPIYPVHIAGMESQQHPWGPLAAEAHAQYGVQAAYRNPQWATHFDAMGNAVYPPQNPKLQTRRAFPGATQSRRAYEDHARETSGPRAIWAPNTLPQRESPAHLRQLMFSSEWRHHNGPAHGGPVAPQLFHPDARSLGAGNAGATATAPIYSDYKHNGLARSPDLTSHMPKKARHASGQGASRRRAKESAIPAARPKSGRTVRDRSYNTAAIGTYDHIVPEENPAISLAVTPQGFAGVISPQLKEISPRVVGDIARHPPQAALTYAYLQDTPRTDIWAADNNYDIAALASPAYTQTPRVDRVARVDELSHHRYLVEDASTKQPEAPIQDCSLSWQMYSTSPSASTSSLSEPRYTAVPEGKRSAYTSTM